MKVIQNLLIIATLLNITPAHANPSAFRCMLKWSKQTYALGFAVTATEHMLNVREQSPVLRNSLFPAHKTIHKIAQAIALPALAGEYTADMLFPPVYRLPLQASFSTEHIRHFVPDNELMWLFCRD